jgi:hypothetical protein
VTKASGKNKGAARGAGKSSSRMSGDQEYQLGMVEAHRRIVIVDAIKQVLLAIICALGVLALWPTANVLSGRETSVNLALSYGPTVGVSVMLVLTGAWGKRQKQRADRLERRARVTGVRSDKPAVEAAASADLAAG